MEIQAPIIKTPVKTFHDMVEDFASGRTRSILVIAIDPEGKALATNYFANGHPYRDMAAAARLAQEFIHRVDRTLALAGKKDG